VPSRWIPSLPGLSTDEAEAEAEAEETEVPNRTGHEVELREAYGVREEDLERVAEEAAEVMPAGTEVGEEEEEEEAEANQMTSR
jgi:hypothetical protein